MLIQMNSHTLKHEITTAIGQEPTHIGRLSGGCIGEVYKVTLANGTDVVAKVDRGSDSQLALEAYMLRYLAEHSRLPVPKVLYDGGGLLIIEFLPGGSHFSAGAQRHAAELLAGLHSVRGPAFGLEQDTLIGSLHQPNPWTDSWLAFFREQRLLYMAHLAARAGRMPTNVLRRIEKLGDRLDQWLEEPEHPSLIHGDVWTTNVLASGNRITGFLDPAAYYAHPEIELAYITLFSTFDEPFFETYSELRPLDPGFWEVRRDLHNLYPLLVHVRLFGGGYLNSVESILNRFRMR